MASPEKIRTIHALRRQVPSLAEEDAYRDFLGAVTDKRSLRAMTDAEAGRVILSLGRIVDGKPAAAPMAPARSAPDPGKDPLIRRIFVEAYAADWHLPTEAGAFDRSEAANRSRARARILGWLQEHHPHLQGSKAARIDDWPMESLQHLVEHLKGSRKASQRWQGASRR